MNAPKPHAEAQARPPKPAECADGCPDQQVCDHCQWPPGQDAEAQAQAQGGWEVGCISGEPQRVQQFGEPVYYLYTVLVEGVPNPLLIPGTKIYTAPPSAPVGVPSDILRIVDTAIDVCNDRDRPAMAEDLEAVRLYVEQASAALAQQPAAVDADKVFHAVSAYVSPADRSYFRKALEAVLAAQPGGSDNDR